MLVAAPFDFFMVKGPVLATSYPRPADRRYNDLDIVVSPRAVDNAIRAIADLGGHLLDANWEAALRDRWGQVHLRMPHGTLVDLHWHLVNMGPIRDTLAVDMADAWRDLRTVRIPGGQVQTLSVTNTVVHVAMHAALGGAWQRRWFADIAAIVGCHDIDWNAVVARARDWGVARLTGVALDRSRRIGRANVPSAVVAALLSRPLTPAVVGRLDRWWPPQASNHEWSPARLWTHLLRDDVGGIAHAVRWRATRRLRGGVRGFAHGRTMPLEMEPTGGDEAKERFLNAVHAGRWC